MSTRFLWLALGAIGLAAGGAAGGYWWAMQERALPGTKAPAVAHAEHTAAKPGTSQSRRVLYWYDPMYPQQRFDAPGKSPYMDMELLPKYAEAGGEAAVRIDPAITQNLGMRTAPVEHGTLAQTLSAVGTIAYNARDLAVVQARTAGYVERVRRLAPGDVVQAGAVLAELLVPEWAGAQTEFLALSASGDAALAAAARERLRLLGMPAGLIETVERTRQPRPLFTVTIPAGGVIDTLDVRAGMTVAAGQTLATVRGLDPVWLDVAVPEASGAWVGIGDEVEARITALPGAPLTGTVIDVLPAADIATRTFTVRASIANPHHRLRPGMFANVTLRGDSPRHALLVPSEAVIRTGKRQLVMVAEEAGRYRPVGIVAGREQGGRTEVLRGLAAGQRVVTSGQFLIDSEASLAGLVERASEPAPRPAATAELHEAEATVSEVSARDIKLEHGPIATLGMPGMTMTYVLASPDLAEGIEPGARVRVAVRESADGLVVERLERLPR